MYCWSSRVATAVSRRCIKIYNFYLYKLLSSNLIDPNNVTIAPLKVWVRSLCEIIFAPALINNMHALCKIPNQIHYLCSWPRLNCYWSDLMRVHNVHTADADWQVSNTDSCNSNSVPNSWVVCAWSPYACTIVVLVDPVYNKLSHIIIVCMHRFCTGWLSLKSVSNLWDLKTRDIYLLIRLGMCTRKWNLGVKFLL